jgi:DNA-binding NarL/FixJ family response regulator
MSLRDDAGLPDRARVALLDDHVLLLDSFSSWIIDHAPEFDLALRASSWLELVHSPAFPTDLVIMDLQLREAVSIEARIRTCRAAGAKVIILSASDAAADRERARKAGALAYLSKSEPMTSVIAAARSVLGLDEEPVAEVDWRPRPIGAVALVRPRLSTGEREALTLYADGHTVSEVASLMGVRYETAKTYLRRIREKYGKAGRPTSSRADLIRRAAEDGYLT